MVKMQWEMLVKQLRARVSVLRKNAEHKKRTAEEAVAYLPHYFTEAQAMDKRADAIERALRILDIEMLASSVVPGEEDFIEL